jgi:carbamoyl-phosphate synthase large subunit
LRTDMNINRVFKLVDTCGQVPKHLITIRLWSRNWKADGTRYVDNEMLLPIKEDNRSWLKIELDKELNLITPVFTGTCSKSAVMKPSWSTVILKRFLLILIQLINCISNCFLGTHLRYYQTWKPEGVIVQLGGQTALKLAEKFLNYKIMELALMLWI